MQRIAAAASSWLDAELATLTQSREQLRRLVDTCDTGPDTDCLDLPAA